MVSAQKEASDRNVHGYIRHQIGHIAFSCWLLANGFEDRCPRRAWCGAAHTLQKMRPLQDGYATYCVGEKGGANGPRDAWPHRLDLLLKKPLPPIESFFAKNSLSDLEWADHLRAWSLVETGLRLLVPRQRDPVLDLGQHGLRRRLHRLDAQRQLAATSPGR